ncbi:MAG: amidohydrolase family protein [Candidatus Latescibacterota bacterium]
MKRLFLLFLLFAGLGIVVSSCRSNRSAAGESIPYISSRDAVSRTPVYRRIKAAVDDIRLIDVHEHLSSEQLRLKDKVDFFYWFQHYSSSDLVSSGMKAADLRFLQDPSNPSEARWAKMAAFWPHVKFTGYGQALRIAARDLYGIPDIDADSWRTLSERITAANKPGFYDATLKGRAKIDLAILDCVTDDPYLEAKPGFFVYAKDFDPLISMKNSAGLAKIESQYGFTLRSVNDIPALLDCEFARFPEQNIVSVKCKQAYHRTLLFRDAPLSEAERALNLIRASKEELPFETRRALEDFIMHRIVERCGKFDIPLQIHTGLQEGNGTDELTGPWDANTVITDSSPVNLINLIRTYPAARFDIFHAGFPYLGEMTTLAKNFQNVQLNLGWLAIISPTTCREWLHRWIETVPANKIEFFGGDYRFAEGTYGHSVIAREIVARTLAEKVEEGYMSEEEAIYYARRILRENAIEFFKLERFLK